MSENFYVFYEKVKSIHVYIFRNERFGESQVHSVF